MTPLVVGWLIRFSVDGYSLIVAELDVQREALLRGPAAAAGLALADRPARSASVWMALMRSAVGVEASWRCRRGPAWHPPT